MKRSIVLAIAFAVTLVCFSTGAARMYQPETGRYLTPDPIGLSGGDVNLYAYTRNNPVNLIDPSGLIWVTTGTSFSGYRINNFGKWVLNRVTRQIGEGMDPTMPGSDPSEFLGLKRNTMQEWRSDPNNKCRDKEFPLGTRRNISQTYQRYPFGYPEPSVVDPDSPSAEGYGWFPGVPNNTYNGYPGTTYLNLFYWRQGK